MNIDNELTCNLDYYGIPHTRPNRDTHRRHHRNTRRGVHI